MVDRGGTTQRRTSVLIGTALVLMVSGCAGASASATSSDGGSLSPEPATPFSSPTTTTAPSASATVLVGFQYGDILRVEVNRLAVRQAPLLSSPLAQGYRFDGVSNVPTGDIRLNPGDFVSVHLGPLQVGDTIWYLVRPAKGGGSTAAPVAWDAGSGVGPGDPAWVAASVGADQYLTLDRRPETSEIEQFLPVGITMSGTGDGESESQPRHDMFLFNWAAAVIDDSAPCAFSVTLRPDDGTDPPVVAAQASTPNVAQGALQGPGAVASTPWAPTPAGGLGHSFTVSVKSGCAWSVGLHSLAHD